MIDGFYEQWWLVMRNGGAVMWPLLVLSLVSATLIFERCWFWISTNHPGRLAKFTTISQQLRRGQIDTALQSARDDASVYGQLVTRITEGANDSDAATEAIESLRARIERFMPTLSTVITAAPMLGILGTVFGIISSFQLLSQQTAVTDPRDVSGGIAEALLTTAVGLTVAIVVLFPYNAFRAQIDRTLGRLELLAAAATARSRPSPKQTHPNEPDPIKPELL